MIIDGRHIAHTMEAELAEQLSHGPQKKVCFIQFGNDPASKKFIEMKSRVALRLGILVDVLQKEDIISTNFALEIVETAARDSYDGIVVQLPLPVGLDVHAILNAVPAHLDIDVLGDEAKAAGNMIPPVARAVWEILKAQKVDLSDKKIVVVGNGALVGQPVAEMFMQQGRAVAVIDKETPNDERAEMLASADVIISGVGVPGLIKPDMIKSGVVLIDAGTSESAGKLVGDIDPSCEAVASMMTPVPGGVGPVTVMSLFKNLAV